MSGVTNYIEELLSSGDTSYTGCFNIKGMWRAVILQAIIDATSNYKRTENRLEKEKARIWLSEMSDDFIMVCSMAGYDPGYVRHQASRVIKERGVNIQSMLRKVSG